MCENTPGRLLRHALGVHGRKHRGRMRWRKPYRNYYTTSSETLPLWEALVSQGLAVKTAVDFHPYATFYVTVAGQEYALEGISFSQHHTARYGYGTPKNK